MTRGVFGVNLVCACCSWWLFILGWCSERQAVLLLRYGEAHRAGDGCCWKGGLLLTVPKGRGQALLLRATWGVLRLVRGTGSKGKIWTRVFIVVSVGRKDEAEWTGWVSSFSSLWGIGALSGRLVPGPGVVRAGEYGRPPYPHFHLLWFQLPVVISSL